MLQSLNADSWPTLDYHAMQQAFYYSIHRFNMAPAGRRSGKTEIVIRRCIKKAVRPQRFNDGRYILAAPTHIQAKDIFWQKTKRMIMPDMLKFPSRPEKSISESERTIYLWNNARIQIMGMDVPSRSEGTPVDHIALDEYGNMKAHVWDEHVRPSLSTRNRPGTADFIGVPEGRNHYYLLWMKALRNKLWGTYTWYSSDILDAEEIKIAMAELDPQTFAQEYQASFVNLQGRAYYGFDQEINAGYGVTYNPKKDLIFCFDFNVEPGVCAIAQEFQKKDIRRKIPHLADTFTGIVGEVYIDKNSNTERVCNRLLQDWGKHERNVRIYGDTTGGQRRSSALEGSDWQIIRNMLGGHFKEKYKDMKPRGNPPERERVNAVNSRIKSTDGKIHMLVDPDNAWHVVQDLEGVGLLKGGSGEIEKKPGDPLTHISDALGYYVAEKFPLKPVILGTSTTQDI